jgi:hypothetical protein
MACAALCHQGSPTWQNPNSAFVSVGLALTVHCCCCCCCCFCPTALKVEKATCSAPGQKQVSGRKML